MKIETIKMKHQSSSDHELVLARIIEAPRERVFRAWTRELPRWWGPHGMTTPIHQMDLRPGGVFRTVMRAPDGREYPTLGVFLQVVEPAKIVFTDAYEANWEPNPSAFFTAVISFDPMSENRTRYTVRALHWTTANCEKHQRMGFHQGWGESADRLAAVVASERTRM